ncbi:MAG: DNA polymerase III subunit epsilon [Alphaproteobacteria bacterium]
MREVALDTETTGLDPAGGHRIVEIACVELVNHVPTGREFQVYLNPERPMSPEAEDMHGLTDEFLADKSTFPAVVDELLTFLGDDRLVIHNAEFDIGFLNAELERVDYPPLSMERAVDTVELARRKFPGAQASLDALCRRFDIDVSARAKHGALLDAKLLAAVYLELIGGPQPRLALALASAAARAEAGSQSARPAPRPARPHAPTAEEQVAHEAFLDLLKDPIWRR